MMPATNKDNQLICEAYMANTIYYVYGQQERGSEESSGIKVWKNAPPLTPETFKALAIKKLDAFKPNMETGKYIASIWDEWFDNGTEVPGVLAWGNDDGFFISASNSIEALSQYEAKYHQGFGEEEV